MTMHMPRDKFQANSAIAPYSPAEPHGLVGRFSDVLRRTNWVAVLVSAALQGGFLAVLIGMGVVATVERPRDNPLVAVLSTATRPQPAPPPSSAKEVAENTVVPKAEVIAPTPKLQISTAPPVAAAERVAEAPAPSPAPAAPSPAAPPAAPSAGSGPVAVANLTTNLLSGSPPAYPVESRHKREEGTVTLRLVISRDGRVSAISVQRSSGFPNLDEAALTAVRKWRWSPTIRDGRPVEISGLVRIPFILRKS